MATVEIPVSSVHEHHELRVTLDGVALGLEFRWNDRAGAWYLDLLDADGEVIAAGRKVVIDYPLMALGLRDADSRLPGGVLWAADTSGAGTRPGRDELGARVRLYYLEATP